ncbi:putative MFS-type transporter [Geobacter sp. OR-1]|uniref:MFS transporter n=1 Tax=Geobacter sp. OR-1 TaxID=1266765 RepID=UPI000543D106|nr:MFS transporter [Geobacter sp. OR-1]GAM08254.1 putative MFS-type transporter [Geobacter sp. OR-1]
MTDSKRSLAPFLLLCLIGFAAFFCSYMRIPVLPLFAAGLGADAAEVGLINGAFMVTAGILSIPAGLLVDRFGRKMPVVGGIMATALSSLLITQCRFPGEMAAVYLLFGAGMAAFAPGMLSLVADTVPLNRLGQAYGWYTTAVYMAMTLGPATGGYLAKTVGLREVFFVSGGLLAAIASAALLLLPAGVPRHKTGMHAIIAGSRDLLRHKTLVACLLTTAGSSIGFGVFLTFLPLFASSLGYDPAKVGMIFAAQALTNVVSRIPIGSLADRVDRRGIVAIGLICLAMALGLLGKSVHLAQLVGCAVLLGMGMALVFTAIGALIADGVPAAQRGLAMGMYNSCIYLGMMAGSTLMGMALKRIGYPLGFAFAGIVTLLTLLAFVAILRRSKQ